MPNWKERNKTIDETNPTHDKPYPMHKPTNLGTRLGHPISMANKHTRSTKLTESYDGNVLRLMAGIPSLRQTTNKHKADDQTIKNIPRNTHSMENIPTRPTLHSTRNRPNMSHEPTPFTRRSHTSPPKTKTQKDIPNKNKPKNPIHHTDSRPDNRKTRNPSKNSPKRPPPKPQEERPRLPIRFTETPKPKAKKNSLKQLRRPTKEETAHKCPSKRNQPSGKNKNTPQHRDQTTTKWVDHTKQNQMEAKSKQHTRKTLKNDTGKQAIPPI